MSPTKQNVAHSIFQRLLNRAKTNKEDFNLLLSRYGMERFLYRLSISPHNERFILKGASLFLAWKGQNYRVTRDADLLGFGNSDIEQLSDVFRDICCVEFQGDGMIYLPESLNAEESREVQEYDDIRITRVGLLNQARIPLQLDIGFGDVVTPVPEHIEYPTLFDAPPPLLKAYPRYTVVAEKLEAMVKLGLANSRMKDFYDIWLLSRLFSFEGSVLRKALKNTFDRRRTPFPSSAPFAFTPAFYEDPQKTLQWKTFIKKSKPDIPVGDLSAVIVDIDSFLTLCSTVIGSFFQNFVKISNKIKAGADPELKNCRHTDCDFILDIAEDTCFFNGHVCAQYKTEEQGWVRG